MTLSTLLIRRGKSMRVKIITIILTLCSLTSSGQFINEVTKDSLRTVICKMLSEDRRVRTEIVSIEIQKKVDSVQFYQLTMITKMFGYPDKKRIGDSDCSVNAFLILIHNPDRLIEIENYELYLAECRKGNIEGWELGLAFDRYYTHYLKKSMYGLYPQEKPCIEDFETVNRNRKGLNLKELKRESFKACR